MSEIENFLKEVFTRESLSNRRYIFFAKIAESEGQSDVADLFKNIAKEETDHAMELFKMLYPNMTTKLALNISIEEEIVDTEVYQQYATLAEKKQKTAEAEELKHLFKKAREHLETLAEAEKSHEKTYRKSLERSFPEV
jgi:rubrerythrin